MAIGKIGDLVKCKFTFWWYILKVIPFEVIAKLIQNRPLFTFTVGGVKSIITAKDAR